MDIDTQKPFHMTGKSSLAGLSADDIWCYVLSVQINGYAGAVNIVKVLKSRRVNLQFVLDEGLAVLDGLISGLNGPAAL